MTESTGLIDDAKVAEKRKRKEKVVHRGGGD